MRLAIAGVRVLLLGYASVLSSGCVPARDETTSELASLEELALWRDLTTLRVGGGSEWVYVDGTWSDAAVEEVLKETSPEVIRFPGGLFANVWNLSADTLLTLASRAGGYRGRLDSYQRRLRSGTTLLADSALIQYAHRSGARLLWVMSPFDGSLRANANHVLARTRQGDTALIELGNEIYDDWFPSHTLSPRDLAAMRDSLSMFARERGRSIQVALPSSVGDAGARRPLWELERARLSIDPVAVHLYVGEHPDVCASCGAREYVHALTTRVLEHTGRQRLWITELNVDARRNEVRAGRRTFTIGDTDHGLLVASLLLHFATEERVDLLLVHALMGSGAYGLYQSATSPQGTTWNLGSGLGPVVHVLRLLSRADAIREVRCASDRPEDECFEICEGTELVAVRADWQDVELFLLSTESAACLRRTR